MHREATQPCDGPAGRQAESERVRVVRKTHALRTEVRDRRDEASEHAACRREPIPDLQDLPGAGGAVQLLRMIEKEMHEMGDDDPGSNAPRYEAEKRTKLQAAADRLPFDETGCEIDAGRGEHSEGLDRDRPELQGRKLEIGNHVRLFLI
jgi:hypothetical protein